MAAKMMTTSTKVAAPVAQTSVRAQRMGAFTGFKPSAAFLGKSAETTFSTAVSGRVGAVQVRCASKQVADCTINRANSIRTFAI